MSKSTTSLTRREREIIGTSSSPWARHGPRGPRGPVRAAELLAVRALLRLLEERGHVKHVEEDQRYVYRPVMTRGDARKGALAHLVKTFFSGSVEQAMAALVETSRSKLSREELDRLAEIINRAKKEGR